MTNALHDFLIKMGYVALHTVVIYVLLIGALRLVGRRQLGQLNVVDLVVIMLLGSAVETAMVSGDTSLMAGLVCSTVLFGANRLFSFLAWRYPPWRHLVAGETLVLVNNGVPVEENLRRAGMTHDDLDIALRERGHESCDEIRYAILEADGAVNVVPANDDTVPLESDTVVGGLAEATATPVATNRP